MTGVRFVAFTEHPLWPLVVRVASILTPAVVVAAGVVGVVMYTTAESQPDLREDAYAPGEVIDIPGAYRLDGMVLWGKPAAVDLADVSCRVVFTTREEELGVGPRDADEDLAVHTDPAHGEVAYLASTATVLGLPSGAACDGDGLEQVLVSADRDVEGSKETGRFALASAAMFLLLGIVLRMYSRRLGLGQGGSGR